MKLIVLIIFLFSLGVIFVYSNITFEYPTKQVCNIIKDFKKKYEHLPTEEEFKLMNIPDVGLFSIRKYKVSDNDFVFYFCPTILGPCEICTFNKEPYFDEI